MPNPQTVPSFQANETRTATQQQNTTAGRAKADGLQNGKGRPYLRDHVSARLAKIGQGAVGGITTFV